MTMSIDDINMRIAELEQSLLAKNPLMPTFLRSIHAELLKNPELVHVMSDEQRAIVIRALQTQTGVEVIAATAKKRSSPKKVENLASLL